MERITLAEAAKQTGIDTSTMRHWCADGLVPATKPGRDYMVYLVDIERYIDEHQVRPRRPHKKRRKSDPEKQG
jgi:excisionase family DNA binding protein